MDIKDFQSVSAVADADNVLLSRSGGTHGKMRVSLFKQAVMQGLTPRIQDEVWYVGDTNTGVQARGKTPVLETGTVQTLTPGSSATFSVEADGTDDSGNPKYKVNAGIPRGDKGEAGSGFGNVKVTNAASLLENTRYAFIPSAKGSTEGTFSTIPYASNNTAGLMSSDLYNKLSGMKDIWKVPSAVAGLTDESTNEEIVSAFGDSTEDLSIIVYYVLALANEYDTTWIPKTYIGNRECLLSGGIEQDDSEAQVLSATLFFTYADAGKLHTIGITFHGETSSGITYTCKISESGGANEYYLPIAVNNLSEDSTVEEISEAFGGADGISSLTEAVKTGANIYIKTTMQSLPVSCFNVLDVLVYVSFLNPQKGLTNIYLAANDSTKNYAKVIGFDKDRDYILSPLFISLNSSSQPEGISEVFGGVDGFKAMGAAAKNNRTVRISGVLNGANISYPCSIMYSEDSANIGAVITYMSDVVNCCVVTYNISTGQFSFTKV